MPRSLRLALAAVAAAAALAPTTAHALPHAAATVTFGLGPADAHGPDGRAAFTFTAAPGAYVDDHVAVLNYSNRALPLSVYATDGYNTYSGAQSLLEADKSPTGVGAWVRIAAPKLVTVPPRHGLGSPGSVVLPFRLSVPKAAEPGDHVGGLVASLRVHSRNAQGVNVSLDQRVATPLLLRVTGTLHPGLAVVDLRPHYRNNWNPFGRGSVQVRYTVRNVGNVRLGGRQRVDASGLLGSWAAGRLVDVPVLLPGGQAHLQTTVPGVWPELWMRSTVRVTALATAADARRPVERAVASTHFWAVPWSLLALLLLLWLVTRVALRVAARRPSPKHARGRAAAVPVIELPKEPVA